MVLWTSDKYIVSMKKLTLSQKQTLNHGGSAQTHYQDKYAHMCVRIDSVSYTRFDMGVILVYTQYDLWVSDKYLAGIKNFSLSRKHTHNPLVLKK